MLITGAPGTAKTTLCGAFAEATCRRGEPTLFVSFDSRADEVLRNLSSVGIDLAPLVEQGLLHIVSARSVHASAEVHLLRIKSWAKERGARSLIIDPVSAIAKAGHLSRNRSVVERLVDWAKVEGLTLLCSSLLDHSDPRAEATPLDISTIADTWIHLSYRIHAGERNRGLSIVKSRGTAHSNQVRELVLTDRGATLADVFTAGGEILMGTMRFQKERAEQLARDAADREREVQRVRLDAEIAALERQLVERRAAQAALSRSTAEHLEERELADSELRNLRGADAPPSSRAPDHG